MKHFLMAAMALIFLGACGAGKEQQAFADDAGGIWYNVDDDTFFIAYDDFRVQTFSAIALEKPENFETGEFEKLADLELALNVEKSDLENKTYALKDREEDAEGEKGVRYLAVSEAGTLMKLTNNWNELESTYRYIGAVEDFSTAAAEIYEPQNRPYRPVDHKIFLSLNKRKEAFGITEVNFLPGNGMVATIGDGSHPLSKALQYMMEGQHLDSEMSQWENARDYFIELAREAAVGGSDLTLYVNHDTGNETESLGVLLQLKSGSRVLVDYVADYYGEGSKF